MFYKLIILICHYSTLKGLKFIIEISFFVKPKPLIFILKILIVSY